MTLNLQRNADVGMLSRLAPATHLAPAAPSIDVPIDHIVDQPIDLDDFDAAVAVPTRRRAKWEIAYLRNILGLDFTVALLAGLVGFLLRFDDPTTIVQFRYLGFAVALPVVWIVFLALNRAYEQRFLYDGSEEMRRVFRAGLMLVAAVSFIAYALQLDFSRGYMFGSFPIAVLGTTMCRHAVRKNLHRSRASGACMERTIVVGHTHPVADMMDRLRRQQHHGLDVVAACLPPGVNPEGGLAGSHLPVTRAQDIVATSTLR